MKKKLFLLPLFLLTFSLTACGGGNNPGPSDPSDPSGGQTSKDPELDITSKTIKVDEEFTLTLKNPPEEPAIWSSQGNAVLITLNSMVKPTSAVIKGLQAGEATVTVLAGDKTLTCRVTVQAKTTPSEEVVVNLYLKNSQGIGWWPSDDQVTYAYVWNGEGDAATNKQFLATEFVELLDNNTTAYYKIKVTAAPEKLLLIRCDKTIVTSVPTSWPERGIFNQTNDATVSQGENGYYCDLTVKA